MPGRGERGGGRGEGGEGRGEGGEGRGKGVCVREERDGCVKRSVCVCKGERGVCKHVHQQCITMFLCAVDVQCTDLWRRVRLGGGRGEGGEGCV